MRTLCQEWTCAGAHKAAAQECSSQAADASQVGTIENKYRVFQMEVIAGESDLETEVKQYKARFRLNYGEGNSPFAPDVCISRKMPQEDVQTCCRALRVLCTVQKAVKFYSGT